MIGFAELKRILGYSIGAMLLYTLCGPYPVWSDEVDWTQLDAPPQSTPVPYQYTQMPANTVPMYMPVQQMPQRRSFLSRLLSPFKPFGTRMIENPPIMQQKVIAKEEPRTLPASPDPLIRLSQGFTYQGVTVMPGFYLLRLQTNPGGQSMLTLNRQKEVLVSLPATTSRSILSNTNTVSMPPSVIPREGIRSSAKNQDKSSDLTEAKEMASKPVIAEAKGRIEFVPGGQQLKLVYQKGGAEYTSVLVDCR